MNYAIIAAGEGARLKDEGIKVPKPLVKVNNVALIDRLINIFAAHGAGSISVIVNAVYGEVMDFLKEKQSSITVPLNIVCETTPSSLHSFYRLAPYLQGDKFCLTTVDTIFKEEEFKKYMEAFSREGEGTDGLMAVTSFVDDEKPLYVEVQSGGQITQFLDENNGHCTCVSGGIYCLQPKTLEVLQRAHDAGLSRMRNFQRMLLSEGLRLKAYPFSKIIDIDHARDIAMATAFLQEL
jgi:NDP-sugar pyrophosphorylase family protein